jgi:hypothetical protein
VKLRCRAAGAQPHVSHGRAAHGLGAPAVTAGLQCSDTLEPRGFASASKPCGGGRSHSRAPPKLIPQDHEMLVQLKASMPRPRRRGGGRRMVARGRLEELTRERRVPAAHPACKGVAVYAAGTPHNAAAGLVPPCHVQVTAAYKMCASARSCVGMCVCACARVCRCTYA